MDVVFSLAGLVMMVLGGIWACLRAKRYADGVDDRRESLASLASLAGVDGLTDDERRAVASLVEFRMQRI